MTGGLRQTMAWFHGWSGVIAGWLLYMMFIGGSAAVFKDEITTWMTPEIRPTVVSPQLLDRATERLAKAAPEASSWTISLPDSRDPAMRLSWRVEEDGPLKREVLNSNGDGTVEPRDTRGGDFFYRLHYRFDQPGRSAWGYSVAAGCLMLVIIVAGIITHKRFFADFFTFRPRASGQRSWLDAHLLLGVLLLPFHLMITYSGLVPIISTVMPFGMIANYGNGEALSTQAFDPSAARKALAEERTGQRAPKKAGIAAPMPALLPFVQRAEAHWGAGAAASINVRNPGDRNAVIEITRSPGGQVSNRQQRLSFRADNGERLTPEKPPRAAAQTQAFLYGFHMARFSDTTLRWAYFIAGLGSAALIATGLVLWTVKRRASRAGLNRWDLLVERLNAGMIVGLPTAMLAFFHANRLLPLDLPQRALMEVRSFFAVWILLTVISALSPRPLVWRIQVALLSAVAIALPFVNMTTTDRGLQNSIAEGNWLMATFDLVILGSGIAAAIFAIKLPVSPAPTETAPRIAQATL